MSSLAASSIAWLSIPLILAGLRFAKKKAIACAQRRAENTVTGGKGGRSGTRHGGEMVRVGGLRQRRQLGHRREDDVAGAFAEFDCVAVRTRGVVRAMMTLNVGATGK